MASYVWKGLSADWTVAKDWTPTGVPGAADTAAISAAGTYTVGIAAAETIKAGKLTLAAAGATLQVDGTFTATALALNAGSIVLNGTIADSTITAGGGTIAYNLGTFSHVTYRGALDLGDAGLLLVQNGLTVTDVAGPGRGEIDVTGTGASLIFNDDETIDNVTINVGSDTGFDSVNANGASLVLGSGVVVNSVGVNGLQLGGPASITSQGTINAGVAGSQAFISSASFSNGGAVNVTGGQVLTVQSADFANTGAVFVDAGSALTFEGATIAASQASGGTVDIEGTLDAGGSTIDLGPNSAFANTTLGGTLANAVIVSNGGTIAYNLGTLQADTFRGTFDLGDSGIAIVQGGLTVTDAAGTGPGVINVTGSGATLIFADDETLDNVTINVGSDTGFDSVNANGGTLTLGSGVVVNSVGVNGLQLGGTAAATNAGRISAAVAGGFASIDLGSFTNAGTIAVGNKQFLSLNSQDGTVTNTGLLSVAGGGTLDVTSALAGSGRVVVGTRSTAELGAVGGGQTISLQGSLVNLVLDQPASVAAKIYGFVSGDRIDLVGVATLGSAVAKVGNTAVVTGASPTATLNFASAGQGFGLVSDGAGNSFLITGRVINGPAGGHATITAPPGNAIINARGFGNKITLASCDGVINAGSGGANVRVGSGNVVVNLAGSLNQVTTGHGSNVVAGSASASLVSLGAGNDQVRLAGNLDAINAGGGNNTVDVTGNLNAIKTGSGDDTITVSGRADLVLLSGGTDSVSVAGSSNAVFLGSGFDTVADAGTGLNVVAASGVGSSVLTGVASDPSFVLDLVGGVGGYTSAAQAYAALTTDGNGGSLLTLGAGSTVDFAGVLSTQLSAKNFAVVPSFHLT